MIDAWLAGLAANPWSLPVLFGLVLADSFIPFARLVVNLTAGAAGIRATRYLPVAGISAALWAAYQALVGATIATLLPGGTLTAVVVSIVVALALALGWIVDAVLARVAPRAGGR